MAVASVDTGGLLNWWAIRMQENLYRFNQLEGDAALPDGYAAYVYTQPERESIAEALQQAVTMVGQQFRLLPRPTFVTDRIAVRRFRIGAPLYTRFGYIAQLGKRATSVVSAGASVTYNGDRATITVSTTVTSPDEIQVFFRTDDGAISAVNDLWRIEPLRVTISGGTATITGHRALFTKPSIWASAYQAPGWNASDKNVGDSDDTASYVSSVDVYRVYADTTAPVRLLLNQGNTDATADTVEVEWTDMDLGEFQPTPEFDRYKQGMVEINYLAGYPLLNGDIHPVVRTALIRLANCELNQTLGVFEPARLTIMQHDVRVETVNDQALDEKGTPFGFKRGQVQAYRTLRGIGVQVLVVDV